MCVCVHYHLICVFAELSFYLCGHMRLCAFPPHISIKHILICIRLYEHPSSSVRCVCVGVCRARSFAGAQPGYGLGAAGGIRDYFLAGKRISRAQGTAWTRLIFLSTASVIPQSLPVRELGPHSELRLGLTKAHKHTKIECTKKGEKREATKGTKGQNGESYGREMRKLRKK